MYLALNLMHNKSVIKSGQGLKKFNVQLVLPDKRMMNFRAFVNQIRLNCKIYDLLDNIWVSSRETSSSKLIPFISGELCKVL